MIVGTRRCFRSTRAYYKRILKGLWHRVTAPQRSLTMHWRRIMMARRRFMWTLSWRRTTTWTSSTWWSTTRRRCENYRKPRLEGPLTRLKPQPLRMRNSRLQVLEIQPSERSRQTMKDTKVDRWMHRAIQLGTKCCLYRPEFDVLFDINLF